MENFHITWKITIRRESGVFINFSIGFKNFGDAGIRRNLKYVGYWSM